MNDEWEPTYSPWRHGGWYVLNTRYPNGGCGCVSSNYADRKWRIVCHPDPFEKQPTYPTRDAAARAEHAMCAEWRRQADQEAEHELRVTEKIAAYQARFGHSLGDPELESAAR